MDMRWGDIRDCSRMDWPLCQGCNEMVEGDQEAGRQLYATLLRWKQGGKEAPPERRSMRRMRGGLPVGGE